MPKQFFGRFHANKKCQRLSFYEINPWIKSPQTANHIEGQFNPARTMDQVKKIPLCLRSQIQWGLD